MSDFYGHLENLHLTRLLQILRRRYAAPSLIERAKRDYANLDGRTDPHKLAAQLLRGEK